MMWTIGDIIITLFMLLIAYAITALIVRAIWPPATPYDDSDDYPETVEQRYRKASGDIHD